MKITGKIHLIKDMQTFSEKFAKRDFVIEYTDNPMYPQHILFQVINKKCSLLDSFQVGQMVDVEFNLRGRSWISPSQEVKYFNSLEAWRIEASDQQPAPTPQPSPQPIEEAEVVGDDLPF